MSARENTSRRPVRRALRIGLPLASIALLLPGPLAAAEGEECVENTAAFPVGTWDAHGVTFIMPIADGFSTGYLEGELAFLVTIDTNGEASGTYAAVDTATVEDDMDLGSSQASIVESGTASGTAAYIEVTGTADFVIDSMIDVSGADGKDFYTGGPVLYDHESAFTTPLSTTIVPSFANCGEVIGNLSQVADSPILFIATRVGTAPEVDADIGVKVVDYLAALESLDRESGIDPQRLADLIVQGELLDSLIAGQAYCSTEELGSVAPGGTVRDLLRSALANNLYAFAGLASNGEYSVASIIGVYGAAIRGALLGGPAGSCVNDDEPVRAGITSAFAQTLINRYFAAVEAGNTAEIGMIRVAAIQYGMSDVTAAIGS